MGQVGYKFTLRDPLCAKSYKSQVIGYIFGVVIYIFLFYLGFIRKKEMKDLVAQILANQGER